VEVWPDEGYRRFYTALLKNRARHVKGRPMLQQALKDSIESRYELWRQSSPLDD
jgi:tRNA isopentenyl-2-thiomethyl-A-37 hydroxylase MiaE